MKFAKYRLPVISWMGIIFYFSSRYKLQVSEVYLIQFLFFKNLHVIEYIILYVLVFRAFKNTRNVPNWQNWYQAFLLSVLYAISDEIHQVFVPTREGRMRDVGIDTLGITISWFILWKYLPKAPKILKVWAKKLDLI
jgi:VanZ family protein